jgi:hypothetical protein
MDQEQLLEGLDNGKGMTLEMERSTNIIYGTFHKRNILNVPEMYYMERSTTVIYGTFHNLNIWNVPLFALDPCFADSCSSHSD